VPRKAPAFALHGAPRKQRLSLNRHLSGSVIDSA
jgi:hypothetical protein